MNDQIFIITATKDTPYGGDLHSAIRYAEKLRDDKMLSASVYRDITWICTFHA